MAKVRLSLFGTCQLMDLDRLTGIFSIYSGTTLIRTNIYRNSGPYSVFSIGFTSVNTPDKENAF